jgi:hypothetical protein
MDGWAADEWQLACRLLERCRLQEHDVVVHWIRIMGYYGPSTVEHVDNWDS